MANTRARQSVTAGHLGGYVVGGDPAARYPHLWEWFVRGPERVRSVIDVGCGDGSSMTMFKARGATSVVGIDGMPQDRSDILEHDFTTGPLPVQLTADLVWTCEFVEHVEEQYLPNILPIMCAGRLLAMTHAVPGQPGWHHVNCQAQAYWIDAVTGYGTHQLDEQLTAKARQKAARNRNPSNYFARTGLVFRRLP